MEKIFFIFLFGTTILNLALTLSARSELEARLFKQLLSYWVSLFIAICASALLSHSPPEIAFAYFFQFVPTFIMSNILIRSRNMDFHWTPFLVAQGFCAFISAGLILITPYNFTFNLIPITISTVIPLVIPAYETLIKNPGRSNNIEKALAVVFLLGIFHHFNYAFFRLKEDSASWAWIISAVHFQGLMVILPLLIVHQNKLKERLNLTHALNQLIGSNQMMNLKVENLYENLNEQISQKNKLLIGLNEQREMNEHLIRTVSHDVATPLTVINAYTDLLASGRVKAEELPQTYEKIKKNSLAAQSILARLKGNILTQSSKKIIQLRPIVLKNAIEECIQRFDSVLQQKNLEVKVSPMTMDLCILSDPDVLVEHIFSNVMANAIKFSHTNSVIDIFIHEDQSYVSIVFKDYGVGISPERLKKNLESIQENGQGLKVTSYFIKRQEAEFHLSSPGENLGTEAAFTFKKVKSNS